MMEWYNWAFVGFSCMIAGLTVVGNTLVILSWICHRPIRNPPNLYLVSLSFVDLLVGLVLFPLYIGTQMNEGKWAFGETLCKSYLVILVTLCSASILHL